MTASMADSDGDSQKLWLSIQRGIPRAAVTLGAASSSAYLTDPRMVGFMAARYKFVAKVLQGSPVALEVGCGDAFGAPWVAQSVGSLICTDIDADTLADNAQRLAALPNISFGYHDFRKSAYPRSVPAVYSVDVLEHIFAHEEAGWLANVFASLAPYGVALFGTPNKAAEKYASAHSRAGHVNLKTFHELRELMQKHFHTVFMFGMNDEVLHTGYSEMCHYLWALCAGPKR
jgi:cyclopropane fatty-acyl-phospholipid synthase-like methyltransferase